MTPLQELQARISILRDLITIVTTLVAAGVALWGIHAWREQLKGKIEFELAQKLLRATYRIRNAFAEVRLPAIWEDEMYQAVKEENIDIDPNLDNEKKHLIAVRAAYTRRWRKVTEAFVELDTLSLEAEAIWGHIVNGTLTPLRNCANTLGITVQEYLERREHPQHYSDDECRAERQIVFATSTDKDNFFSSEITAAVSNIENFLKPHLKI